jgi:hypothetical protein
LEKGGEFQVEAAIAEEFVTQFLVEKVRSKIVCELTNEDIKNGNQVLIGEALDPDFAIMYKQVEERHRGVLIPRLLGTVFHDLVEEEIWMALKKHKFPTVDFKKLRQHSILRTKKFAADLF